MTQEQRNFFYKEYGINYQFSVIDDKYEYGHYQSTNNPNVFIPYKFSLKMLNK